LSETEKLADGVKSRDARCVARAISLIESGDECSVSLLEMLECSGPPALGITGAPGVGKSTLADALIRHYRSMDKTIGVVAVDPSSPITGGAVLGDRVRMHRHYTDEGVFIRSMATRGAYGGLAPASMGAIKVLSAAGYDMILVETVGVGQSEVEIMHLADVVGLVLIPGMGDSIQTLKAGIMEIADVFVLNKADLNGIDELERQVMDFIHMSGKNDYGSMIIKTVASKNTGIDKLSEAVTEILGRKKCR